MYKFKLEKIKFNDGSELVPNSLTVIVGPNNCGKSRILKDINNLITDERKNPYTVIVKDIRFNMPNSLEELLNSYDIDIHVDEYQQVYIRGLKSNMTDEYRVFVGDGWKENCKSWLENFHPDKLLLFRQWFGHNFVTMLDTERRLQLVTEKESEDIYSSTTNLLNMFYLQETELENKLRQIIRDTFNLDIKLDFSALRKLKFRIGKDLSAIPVDPREARTIFEKYDTLDEQGDGLKSFVATVLAILLSKKDILLLDEPEAFLHPPQAMKLGEYIAQYADKEKQVIVATHSSDLLRGIISKTQNVSIIRVNRMENTNRINILNPSEVEKIANDPLLGSSRVLEGIFYKGTVVVEGDSDSAFYQRIARQISTSDDIHYTHAHNKQTVHKLIHPYKNLGVNAAAIVDFDVLRDQSEFKNLLDRMDFEQQEIRNLLQLRSSIVAEIENIDIDKQLDNLIEDVNNFLKTIIEKRKHQDRREILESELRKLKKISQNNTVWSKYKKEGYKVLSEEGQKYFKQLWDICSSKGLFIVPIGELESWLVEYGLERSSNKTAWIVKALEKIPELEIDIEKDPWNFVKKVHDYLLK